MPELVPAWRQLTAMLGGDSEAGAALALWNPPPFLTGCSQAAVLPGGPALVRNYDWDYRLFDGVVASTATSLNIYRSTVSFSAGFLSAVVGGN
jgi:predicted choloylglycine hydrolase